jgi:hypothetical protein
MNIPEMATKVPAVLENALTQWEWACESFARSPSCDSVGRRGSILQQLLGYHLQRVDVMDICKMTAKGVGQHDLPALTTLHWAGIPFGGCNPAALHPAV